MDGERLSGGLGLWEQRKYEGSGQVPFLLAEEGMGGLVIHLLAERAPSEGPRSTRAIEDRPGRPVRQDTSELGRIIYDRARPMCAVKDSQATPLGEKA